METYLYATIDFILCIEEVWISSYIHANSCPDFRFKPYNAFEYFFLFEANARHLAFWTTIHNPLESAKVYVCANECVFVWGLKMNIWHALSSLFILFFEKDNYFRTHVKAFQLDICSHQIPVFLHDCRSQT